MKQGLILIIGLVIVAGGVYWFLVVNGGVNSMRQDSMTTDDGQGSDTDNAKPDAIENSNYVGLTEAEAEVLAAENEVPFRVVERDGEPLPTTRDYRPGRINAVSTAGMVTSFTVEGAESSGAAAGEVGDGANAQVVHDAIVGMTEVAAEALAKKYNVSFRVVEREGESLAVTEDWRPGRINAVVEGGVVTSFTVEGEEIGGVTENDVVAEGKHDAIVGMTQAEAEAYTETNGVPLRIGVLNGEALPVTMDYRPGRITASVAGGVVTSYTVE